MGYVWCAPCVVRHRTESWASNLRKYARETGNSSLTRHEKKCWEFYNVVYDQGLSVDESCCAIPLYPSHCLSTPCGGPSTFVDSPWHHHENQCRADRRHIRFALIAGQQRNLYEDRNQPCGIVRNGPRVRRLYFAPQCVPVTAGTRLLSLLNHKEEQNYD